MARIEIQRVVLLLGVVVVAAAADPHPFSTPTAIALGVLAAVLLATVDRRAVLEAGLASSLAVLAAFRGVAAPLPAAAPFPFITGRRDSVPSTRRGAFRRLQRPDVPGKPRARAPGRT